MTERDADDPDAYNLGVGEQIYLFLDEHRRAISGSLDGLSEEQARGRMVPSSTTLLGLVKHATFVERVWFEEAFTGQSRSVLGIEAGPEESFQLDTGDTIDSVKAGYQAACQLSRDAVHGLTLDDVVTGNRRGALPLRWILLHMLRELAQHCGHADILREQILARPDGPLRPPPGRRNACRRMNIQERVPEHRRAVQERWSARRCVNILERYQPV